MPAMRDHNRPSSFINGRKNPRSDSKTRPARKNSGSISLDQANQAHIRRTVTPHVLRHTFSAAYIQKGISARALQELLRHDRLACTEIYLNLSPEDVIREFHSKW